MYQPRSETQHVAEAICERPPQRIGFLQITARFQEDRVFEKSPVAFLDELVRNVGGTQRWWADQVRAGKIPAPKIGGHWCLTREDLNEALESFRRNVSPVRQPIDDDLGLTETARRRTSASGQ